jgi:hypothetical protein
MALHRTRVGHELYLTNERGQLVYKRWIDTPGARAGSYGRVFHANEGRTAAAQDTPDSRKFRVEIEQKL